MEQATAAWGKHLWASLKNEEVRKIQKTFPILHKMVKFAYFSIVESVRTLLSEDKKPDARSHFLFHLSGCPSTSTSPAYRRFLARSLKIRDAIARTKWYGSETKRNKNMKIRWKSSKKLEKTYASLRERKLLSSACPKSSQRIHLAARFKPTGSFWIAGDRRIKNDYHIASCAWREAP